MSVLQACAEKRQRLEGQLAEQRNTFRQVQEVMSYLDSHQALLSSVFIHSSTIMTLLDLSTGCVADANSYPHIHSPPFTAPHPPAVIHPTRRCNV